MTRRRWIAEHWDEATATIIGAQAEHMARVLRAQRLRNLIERIDREHPEHSADFNGIQLRAAAGDGLIERG